MVAKSLRKTLEVGDRFGLLTVVRDLGTDNRYGTYARRAECRCDCGALHTAWVSHLRAGTVRSCGCLKQGRRQSALPRGEAALRTVLRSYKANAKNRRIAFDLSEDRMRTLLGQNCSYCGCTPSTVARTRSGYGEFVYNGVDRVNNDLGYVEGNVVPCCNQCNIAKQGLSAPEFLEWARRVVHHAALEENIMRLVW